MTCDVRLPATRGQLRRVRAAAVYREPPLYDAAAGEWVLTFDSDNAALAALAAAQNGGRMDKQPIKSFIDWPTWNRDIRWLACCGGSTAEVWAFRRGYRRGRGIVTCEPGGWLALADLETPIYPWTVITGAQLMGAL